MGRAHPPLLLPRVGAAHGNGTVTTGDTSSSARPGPSHPGGSPAGCTRRRGERRAPASSPPRRAPSLCPPRLRPLRSRRKGSRQAGASWRPPSGPVTSSAAQGRALGAGETQPLSPPASRQEPGRGARGRGYAPRKVPQGVILAGWARLRSDAWTQGHFLLEKVAAKTSASQGPGEPPSPSANQSQGADNH